MNDLAELGTLLKGQQDSWLEERSAAPAAREAFLTAFREQRRPTRTSAKTLAGAASVLAVAAAALLFFWLQAPDRVSASLADGSRVLAVGEELVAAGDPSRLEFSDGSEIVLSRGTRVRMNAFETRGASVGLVRGKLSVSVIHRPETRWRLRAGPYQVRVTGTRFDLAWDETTQRFQLDLKEGEVRISGGALRDERVLRAGQSLTLPTTTEAAVAREPDEPQDSEAEQVVLAPKERTSDPPDKHGAPTIVEATPGDAPISWLKLARSGEYASAYQAAARLGFANLAETAPAAEVLALADVARFSGHGGEARSALLTLRRRFSGSSEAATAAFQLGRLGGDSPEGARWFRTYLTERPSGSLAREASGRLMELLSRLGNEKAARAQANDYLKRYPSGPHAAFARKLTRR